MSDFALTKLLKNQNIERLPDGTVRKIKGDRIIKDPTIAMMAQTMYTPNMMAMPPLKAPPSKMQDTGTAPGLNNQGPWGTGQEQK